MAYYFDRDAIIKALSSVAEDLESKGIGAEIRLVGGAALAIKYFERALTTDVDAALNPETAILKSAQQFAFGEEIQQTWLNSDAKIFIPGDGDSPEWLEVYRRGSVRIFVPSARALLAMKLNAARPGKDERDVALLLALTKVHDVDGASELFESFYPGDVVSTTGLAMLERIFTQGLPPEPVPFVDPFNSTP